VLFQIDPAPLQATLHAREAALARAQADATNAALTAKRLRGLTGKGLVSAQDMDTALAAERSTAAAVKQAQADVESARLDLGYATVTAPIAGRAGRALVTEGALVGQGEATELATIEQIDPLYVNFSQSAAELQTLQDSAHSTGPARVEVLLQDGTPYAQPGTLDFSDLAVDPGTGAVSLRAVLPNPEHRLLPGMFVKLRLTMGQIERAFRLPQAAVARDGQGAYVMVVDKDGKVAQRRLQTHGTTATDWIVTGELADGDQVIVEGLQKVQAGAPAKAVPAAQPSATHP
jgi:membrane fusion protein (multidrug efflux system)